MNLMKWLLVAVVMMGMATIASADPSAARVAQVPDAASTVVLLGLALSALGLVRK